MMPFAGFPAGKTRFTPIPDLFFSELLAQVDSLAEMRVILFVFWAVNRMQGYPRYLTRDELVGESTLMTALGRWQRAFRRGGKRHPRRGTGRRGDAQKYSSNCPMCENEQITDYYLINTAQGRKAAEEVRRGELVLESSGFVHEAHIQASQGEHL